MGLSLAKFNLFDKSNDSKYCAALPPERWKGKAADAFDAKSGDTQITNVKCCPPVIDGTLGTARNRSISIRKAQFPSSQERKDGLRKSLPSHHFEETILSALSVGATKH